MLDSKENGDDWEISGQGESFAGLAASPYLNQNVVFRNAKFVPTPTGRHEIMDMTHNAGAEIGPQS